MSREALRVQDVLEKPIQTACRSSRIYVNVGANNNNNSSNNNNNSSNNSRMHETSATPMPKALGMTACRSSRFHVNVGANSNNNNNNSPFQRLRCPERRKIQGFSRMAAGKGFIGKFDGFRGYAGLHQFRHLQRRIGA